MSKTIKIYPYENKLRRVHITGCFMCNAQGRGSILLASTKLVYRFSSNCIHWYSKWEVVKLKSFELLMIQLYITFFIESPRITKLQNVCECFWYTTCQHQSFTGVHFHPPVSPVSLLPSGCLYSRYLNLYIHFYYILLILLKIHYKKV